MYVKLGVDISSAYCLNLRLQDKGYLMLSICV